MLKIWIWNSDLAWLLLLGLQWILITSFLMLLRNSIDWNNWLLFLMTSSKIELRTILKWSVKSFSSNYLKIPNQWVSMTLLTLNKSILKKKLKFLFQKMLKSNDQLMIFFTLSSTIKLTLLSIPLILEQLNLLSNIISGISIRLFLILLRDHSIKWRIEFVVREKVLLRNRSHFLKSMFY